MGEIRERVIKGMLKKIRSSGKINMVSEHCVENDTIRNMYFTDSYEILSDVVIYNDTKDIFDMVIDADSPIEALNSDYFKCLDEYIAFDNKKDKHINNRLRKIMTCIEKIDETYNLIGLYIDSNEEKISLPEENIPYFITIIKSRSGFVVSYYSDITNKFREIRIISGKDFHEDVYETISRVSSCPADKTYIYEVITSKSHSSSVYLFERDQKFIDLLEGRVKEIRDLNIISKYKK